jgi:hypothetical protein
MYSFLTIEMAFSQLLSLANQSKAWGSVVVKGLRY